MSKDEMNHTFNAMVIGGSKVGKTKLISFLTDKVEENHRYKSTHIGNIVSMIKQYNGIDFMWKFWDTPGDKNMVSYYRASDVIIYCYDASQMGKSSGPVSHIEDIPQEMDNVPIVCVYLGNGPRYSAEGDIYIDLDTGNGCEYLTSSLEQMFCNFRLNQIRKTQIERESLAYKRMTSVVY